MTVNIPEVLAELKNAFDLYEKALNENDVAVLNELFWDSPHTVRYGVAEQLYGHREIKGFRAARSTIDLRRELVKVVLTTYGRGGRQMQTWMRVDGDWKVVAAHVSLLPA